MKITKIFEDYNYELIGKDIDINHLCYNSKKCKNNSMFFAIIGENTDGHVFVEDAINNGAKAVVVEKEVKSKPEAIIKVLDTKDALAFASTKFFNNPSEHLNLIGVTGTNGKTTVTYILEKIFEDCAVIGTVNYRIKDKIFKSENTTPLSLEFNEFLSKCVNENIKNVIMEVSSHGIELNRVKYAHFNCGIYTNLSHEHLDFHKSMESYFNAKKKFFTEILFNSNKKKKFAVVNIDDEYGKRLFDEISDKINVITYGIENKADIFPEKFDISLNGITADIITTNGKIKINSNLIGEFNLYNILAAISVAFGYNINLKKIEKTLNQNIVVPGRLEKVLDKKNYFVDYAHTPDALENVLKTLNKIKGKRRIITVFGCGGDRDKTKRPIMGYIAAKYSDFVVVTSDNPRTEDPFMIIEDILKGIEKAIQENLILDTQYRIIPDRRDAIMIGMRACKNGDILLVAGKGHENYQIIGTEKIHFDDREVIKDIYKKEDYV